MSPDNNLPYRPGVGIALFNKEGKVFIAERLTDKNAWQLPQGGIDEGEDTEKAVFREMKEEIGTDNARIIATIQDWLYYDIPYHISQRAFGGKYRGQKQKWFALEFMGRDEEIDLDAHSHPEFGQWQWVELDAMLSYAVAFKRDIYANVIKAFAPLVSDIRTRNGF